MVAGDGEPTAEAWLAAALDLIHGESTLTLATADQAGPWSAPVYYVFLDGRFFFFSSPESRHIRQALKTESAAASIFRQADSWQHIRGIQMQGVVERVHAVGLSVKVIAAYLQRFPFIHEFFVNNKSLDLNDFYTCFKARSYAFRPTTAYYTDNRLGFGRRQAVDWRSTG